MTNASVSGPFFFRHLEITSDISGNITDCRSALGTMTFDGEGHYSLNAQQTANTLAATPLTGSGPYSVGASGTMSIGNPQRNSLTINAHVGTEAIVGSTTESEDNTFDLFIAVPAATPAQASTLFAGNYYASTLEFPLGVSTYVRSAFFSMSPSGGLFAPIIGSGHALNVNSGAVAAFTLTGGTYTFNGDGSAIANLGTVGNPLSGFKTILPSASGNIILGGSTIAGSHDFLIGVRQYAGTSALANWSGLFYTGGLRYDGRDLASASYAGSANAVPSLKAVATYQREHQVANLATAYDYTGYLPVTINSNGTYSEGALNVLGLGANGKSFTAADVASTDYPQAFSIDFGIAADALSGNGVYVNPQGVLNGGSFSPTGQPISPGEFVTIFGSGLAATETVAQPPYPTALGGVLVTMNSVSAPIYLVSPTQLNVLVPYSLTGSTASIVVTNNGQSSTPLVVPLNTTSPGVFSQDSSGIGPGVITHLNGSLVTTSNPAKKGETVSVYLTGLGAVTPSVADGTAGASSPLSKTNETVNVIIENLPATVSYSGLAPGFPGLYQLNVIVPSGLVASGSMGLAVQTTEAFAEQILIAIQ